MAVHVLPAADIEKLKGWSEAYRSGQSQKKIAETEGVTVVTLRKRAANLGYKFAFDRLRGPSLVNIIDNSPLESWLESQDLAAKELVNA